MTAPLATSRRVRPLLAGLVLALAYCLIGRLGLLLAIPPGYASPIFPSSGIALAALMVFGAQLWPAVLGGSLALNLWLSAEHLSPVAGAVACGIALGATLQALAGAALVRRYVTPPYALNRESDVLKFLLLGGPFSCLVNATIGPATLLTSGIISGQAFFANALAWWLGDALGVVVVAPFVLIWTAAPLDLWRRRRLTVGLPLLISFSLATVFYVNSSRSQQDLSKQAFARSASHVTAAIRKQLDGYVDVIAGAERYITLTPDFTSTQFEQLVGSALARYPGIYALAWIPRVPAADLNRFQSAMRSTGNDDYTVTDFTSTPTQPHLGARAEYYPVLYITPVERNRAVIGVDIASEPTRSAVLQQARDEGRMVTLSGILLRQDGIRVPSLLLIKPVYRSATTPVDQEARRTQLRGYLNGVFHIDEMFLKGLEARDTEGLSFQVLDPALPPGQQLLYQYGEAPMANPGPGAVQWRAQISLGGHELTLVYTPNAGFHPENLGLSAWSFMVCALLFTGLMGAFLLVVSGRGMIVEDLVKQRTAELQTAQAQTIASEATLASFFNSSAVMMGVLEHCEDELIHILVNDAMARFLQHPLAALVGNSARTAGTPAQVIAAVISHCAATKASGQAQTFELAKDRDEGAQILSIALNYIGTTSGGRDRFSYILIDETNRRRAEAQVLETNRDLELLIAKRTQDLQASTELFRQVTEAIDEVFWLVDVRTKAMLYISPSYATIWGRSCASLYEDPTSFLGAVHPEDQPAVLTAFANQAKATYDVEYRIVRPDGSIRWVRDRAFPVVDAHGETARMAGAVSDITASRQAAEREKAADRERSELVVREHSAKEASKLKSEFLANMSHEIRTPINGVLGMTSLLLGGPLSTEQREYADAIRRSGDTLLILINDILDVSKIEAGKLDFEHIPFSLRQIVTDCQMVFAGTVQAKGLALSADIPAGLPAWVQGDPGRLSQILSNLLSNAVKFTSNGSIHLDVQELGRSDGRSQLRFAIKDSGIGLSKAATQRLFQPFSQADSSTTRKFGGTGLGLSICKYLAERMDGAIGVDSVEGSGSTFWFTVNLMLATAPTGVARPASFDPQRPLTGRILIAEDNAINQIIALRMLEKLGLQAVAVSNGLEAVTAVGTGVYDLVLMDCQMPEMDGYAATKAIRSTLSGDLASLPIIALTANAMKGDMEKCLAAGMDDYLSKPFAAAALEEMLRKWLRPRGAKPQEQPLAS